MSVDRPQAMDSLLQRLAPHYQTLSKLGEGGMGTVYLVRHRHLNQIRVAKIMRPSLSEDAALAQRFRREAKVLSGFKHPNIARIYELFANQQGEAAIIMEWVPGEDLKRLTRRLGPAPVAVGLEIGRQILLALEHLHERRFVHRDISPDNVMLTWDSDGSEVPWAVKMIDLGIAKSLADTSGMTATGSFLGKVRYASPERLSTHGALDPRSDLYSFGVMMYELLTGHCPIAGDSPESLVSGHLFRPPKPFADTDVDARLPADLRLSLLGLLAKTPRDRPASAQQVREAWETLLAGPQIQDSAAVERRGSWVTELRAGFDRARSLQVDEPTAGVTATLDGETSASKGLDVDDTTLAVGGARTVHLGPKPGLGDSKTDGSPSDDPHRLPWRVPSRVGVIVALALLSALSLWLWRPLNLRVDLKTEEPPGFDLADSGDPSEAEVPELELPMAALPETAIPRAEAPVPGTSRRPENDPEDATESSGEPSTTAPADFTSEPAPTGTLILLATPWGELRRLSDAQGRALALPESVSTPLALDLLEGVYEAEVVNGPLAQSRRLTVRVDPGTVSRQVVEFESVEPEALLRAMGW